MGHIWFMHDAHLGCALLFLDILAEYTFAVNHTHGFSMSLVCGWNEVGDVLCQVSSNPFCTLEAQQRYFSYRAMFVAIVSQNSFVLVLMGYRTIIARYVAKWGIAQMCLCKTKCQGGYRAILGE